MALFFGCSIFTSTVAFLAIFRTSFSSFSSSVPYVLLMIASPYTMTSLPSISVTFFFEMVTVFFSFGFSFIFLSSMDNFFLNSASSMRFYLIFYSSSVSFLLCSDSTLKSALSKLSVLIELSLFSSSFELSFDSIMIFGTYTLSYSFGPSTSFSLSSSSICRSVTDILMPAVGLLDSASE